MENENDYTKTAVASAAGALESSPVITPLAIVAPAPVRVPQEYRPPVSLLPEQVSQGEILDEYEKRFAGNIGPARNTGGDK